MSEQPLLSEIHDGVALLTMNRPQARNALNRDLRIALWHACAEADANNDVAAIVLTGADPAFCAGLDLKALAEGGLGAVAPSAADLEGADPSRSSPVPELTKPLIGAVNGVAVTGGLELALCCDFLIGSDAARFADTHARVGVMPGWGLTVKLPQAIGIRRARQMSFTGNFVEADQALEWGLLNEVVPHDQLIDRALQLGRDAATIPSDNLAGIRAAYIQAGAAHDDPALEAERNFSTAWTGFDSAEFAERRAGIQERGRSQVNPA